MVNRSKNLGTAAETATVRFLRENGWPSAERRALTGSLDQGDIAGTPGICWEIKAGKAAATAAHSASDAQIDAWLNETETERINARADIGVLVTRRRGIPASRAGAWWAHMRLDDLCSLLGVATAPPSQAAAHMRLDALVPLLHTAGYGTAPQEVAR